MNWPFSQRVEAVRLYTYLLVWHWLRDNNDVTGTTTTTTTTGSNAAAAAAGSVGVFVRRLVLARYVDIVAGSVVPEYELQWQKVQDICGNQAAAAATAAAFVEAFDQSSNNPTRPMLPWLTAKLWEKFVRRASEASSLVRSGTGDESRRLGHKQAQQQHIPIAAGALLLADHIDVLTTFMVGADAAYPVFALCYPALPTTHT